MRNFCLILGNQFFDLFDKINKRKDEENCTRSVKGYNA